MCKRCHLKWSGPVCAAFEPPPPLPPPGLLWHSPTPRLALLPLPLTQYKVKDMSQADFGRLEIELAEAEMPGLMACRSEFGPKQPFKGAKISGSLHMTIQVGAAVPALLPML